MAISGIYALAALDGGPLDPGALAVMGLDDPAMRRRESAGIAAQAIDREEGGRAAHIADRPDGFTLLLGHLEEPDDLADTLGLTRDTPPAALAAAAMARFGADAPRQMIGEWSLLDWHAPSRTLTLLMSEATRDPIYFACERGKIAVSSEIARLTKLDWVGRDFDPLGMMLLWGKARLRRFMSVETIFAKVRRMAPGSREVFRIDGRQTLTLPPMPPVEPWRGSLSEAQEAIEAMLRRIVRGHLARHERVASLVSGGLDSSLLAWLEAAERRPGQPLSFLASVAPEGSDVPDERAFSAAVAERLDVPIRFVSPPADANIYVPDPWMIAHYQAPIASPRHYLYKALYEAAFEDDADVLFDGVYGELTVTNPAPLVAPVWSPRRHVRAWREWRRGQATSLDLPVHVQLSPGMRETFDRAMSFDWQSPFETMPRVHPRSPVGILAAAIKNATVATAAPGARLRHVMPFRDRRLLNLFATMPGAILNQNGLDRAPARLMLEGRLPDQVRLRQRGLPFSPDFLERAEKQALETLARIDGFRAAGADEWLDLKGLEAQLKALSVAGSATFARVHAVQATTAAAAYFEWWAGQ